MEVQFYINNIARCPDIVDIFICKDTISLVQHFHKCSTFLQVDYLQIATAFNKPMILYQFQSIIQPIIHQASDLLLISEHYPDQHSTSLWSSINFRAIYSPEFIKPLIFYAFQSITQNGIHQASDIISIPEQYAADHSTSLWSSINFISIYSP